MHSFTISGSLGSKEEGCHCCIGRQPCSGTGLPWSVDGCQSVSGDASNGTDHEGVTVSYIRGQCHPTWQGLWRGMCLTGYGNLSVSYHVFGVVFHVCN